MMADPQIGPGKAEHVYLGWKIRITDTVIDTKCSARIEVWKPEHDPRSHNGIGVGFLKRATSPTEARDAALEAARKWIDEELA